MRLGIIAPMREEIMPLIEEFGMETYKKVSMVELYRKEMKNITVFACSGGVCKTNIAVATQVLIRETGADAVMLIGVSGALDPDLEIGDVILSESLIHHDVADEILTRTHPYMKESWIFSSIAMLQDIQESLKRRSLSYRVREGKIATGECFVQGEERERIIEKFAADCVDMESAAFAQVCYLNEIPFVVIRAMSDKANESAYETFEKNYKVAAKNSMDIIRWYLSYLKEI